jgi:hypothetical protein
MKEQEYRKCLHFHIPLLIAEQFLSRFGIAKPFACMQYLFHSTCPCFCLVKRVVIIEAHELVGEEAIMLMRLLQLKRFRLDEVALIAPRFLLRRPEKSKSSKKNILAVFPIPKNRKRIQQAKGSARCRVPTSFC